MHIRRDHASHYIRQKSVAFGNGLSRERLLQLCPSARRNQRNVESPLSAQSVEQPRFAIELISLVVKQQAVVRVRHECLIEKGFRVPKPLEIARDGGSVD